MKCPIKSLASQRPRDNATYVFNYSEKQVYKLLHVYYNFRKRLYVLDLILDAWVFIILMFMKVERQCWIKINVRTRGITVTRYT